MAANLFCSIRTVTSISLRELEIRLRGTEIRDSVVQFYTRLPMKPSLNLDFYNEVPKPTKLCFRLRWTHYVKWKT